MRDEAAQHNTAWWARLLDSRFFTRGDEPSRLAVLRLGIAASAGLALALLELKLGRSAFAAFVFGLSVVQALGAYAIHLEMSIAKLGSTTCRGTICRLWCAGQGRMSAPCWRDGGGQRCPSSSCPS